MKKFHLKQIIKEIIKEEKPEQRDVTKLNSSSLMKMINNKTEWEQLIGSIIDMEIKSLTTMQKITILRKKLQSLKKGDKDQTPVDENSNW